MSYLCPVCNGLRKMSAPCPYCLQASEDYGRMYDYWGPYSPYPPIDDMKLTDGLSDFSCHQCVHIAYCRHCRISFRAVVDEWKHL